MLSKVLAKSYFDYVTRRAAIPWVKSGSGWKRALQCNGVEKNEKHRWGIEGLDDSADTRIDMLFAWLSYSVGLPGPSKVDDGHKHRNDVAIDKDIVNLVGYWACEGFHLPMVMSDVKLGLKKEKDNLCVKHVKQVAARTTEVQ